MPPEYVQPYVKAQKNDERDENKVIVALAGKLARIAWAVLRSGETYVKEGRPVAA